MDYRGIYNRNENSNEQRYFEFGAHFRYNDLVRALKDLKESQNKKEKSPNLFNNNLNSNDSNYNELYNQINRQLCEKMTDIISPNKLIQSRNIQPLIQSLSQKLTDIVQSQNNKKQMKHNVTKKKYINSNCSIKQKEKNNNIFNDIKNINMNNNNKFRNIIKGLGQQFKGKYPSSAKPQNISQSRNYLNNKNKKILSKNNIKNIQKSINKKNNLTSQEIKQNKFTEKKIQKPLKNLNNNNNCNNCFKNNDEILYGEAIENNNNSNKQNTQTVQNIIVKPNINISFINNYNTTFLPKNKMKKRSPKKVRSRNNQAMSKLNLIENQVYNIDNNFKIHKDFENINKIYQNNNDNNKDSKNNNKFEIIFSKNNNENIKEKHKKSPFVSPKVKNKDNFNENKKNIIEFNNIIINGNNNIINNELNLKNNKVIQEKIIRNINKKLVKNFNEKTKINKTTNEINQMNVLKNDILVNNYIQNNYEKLYGNFNNSNNIQRNKINYINSINDIKNKKLVIRNNIILANNINDKKIQNNNFINKNEMNYN